MKNWMCPLSEIQPDYNFLLGYHTGEPKEWYCGIKGITFIFMGYWNDPMIGYKGYAFNESWYTDGIYEEFYEETKIDDPYKFPEWLRKHKDLLISELEEAIYNYENEEVSA